jgi:hypothetical protein
MKRYMAFAKAWAVAVVWALSLVVALGAPQVQTAPVKPEGDWRGTLDAGAKLDLILHIVRKDGTLTATLDSRDQGATGLVVDSITVSGKSLRFEMKSLGAEYEGVFSSDGSQIEGEFRQQGQKLALIFKRVAGNDSQGV